MKLTITLFFLLTSAGQLLAQRLELIRPEAYNGIYVPVGRTLNYDDIQGSPYLDDDLIKGYVKFKLGDSLVQFLRYNIYTDEMEYLDGEKLFVIDNVNLLDHVYVNSHFLFYKTYKFRNSFKKGYLEKLVDGKYELFVKYHVDFEKGQPAKSSYHKPTPDRFIKKTPTWYCSINNATIMDFEAENSHLEELFRDDYPAIKDYIKENKLKLRKQEDLIKVFEYYNTELAN